MSKFCETCQLGKQVRHQFLIQTTHVSSKLLEMIHSYVWTTKTKSIGRCKYYVNFINDHTRNVRVYFMKHKGERFQHFLNFKPMVEKEKGVSIKCLRSNGGGTYFQMNSVNIWRNMEFKGSIHVVTPHNIMEFLKGKIGTS
jgi:hypothetical protein